MTNIKTTVRADDAVSECSTTLPPQPPTPTNSLLLAFKIKQTPFPQLASLLGFERWAAGPHFWLHLELPSFSFIVLSKVFQGRCSIHYYPEVAPVRRRLRKVSFSCLKIMWSAFLDSKFSTTGYSSKCWIIRYQRYGRLFLDAIGHWERWLTRFLQILKF